jgi:hypothetical protein
MVLYLDIETSSLHPETGFITCIGLLDSQSGIRQFSADFPSSPANPLSCEEKLLTDFVSHITLSDTLITYNGYAFDIPFIESRCGFHKLGWKFLPDLMDHIDLAIFFKQDFGRRVSKDEAASKFLNIYVPRSLDGAFLSRVYSYGYATHDDHLQMLAHNALDLTTTARMYDSLKKYPDFIKWKNEGKGEKK